MVGKNLHEKLVVAVSSRALFDLEAEHKIFEDEGIEAYRNYQLEHVQTPLNPGWLFLLLEGFSV